MTPNALTIEHSFFVDRRRRRSACPPVEPSPRPMLGRVPRIARLMALAIHFEELLRKGHIRDYAEIARLGPVSRARVTQIMNLLLLAPDIQEASLFLPRVERGRDPIHLRQLQPIALIPEWAKQRRLWTALCGQTLDGNEPEILEKQRGINLRPVPGRGKCPDLERRARRSRRQSQVPLEV